MFTAVVILVPLITLFVWAVVFDRKQRRRRAPGTAHDIGSAARRARGADDARGANSPDHGGGGWGP